MTRVIAAMSGGVDSAVAAGLLLESGYDVVGVTMKMYAPSRPAFARSCCGTQDFDDARLSAAALGIPHYVLDFQEAFRTRVIAPFVEAYRRGHTPNPCVSCNNFVKLGTLLRFADRIGARYVATGHYARVAHEGDAPRLFAARSRAKDQSYALAQLAPAQLARLLLPLGDLEKAQTRERARRLGLPVHAKPDSQDVCFVEGGDYRTLPGLREGATGTDDGNRTVTRPEFVTTSGESVGEHAGIAHYTVGQRRGLPPTHTNDGPRYVLRIDAATDTIVIGREAELGSPALIADAVNLIRPKLFADGAARVRAMTRYRAPLAGAWATLEGDQLTVRFDAPERAVTPGQLVALYDEQTDEVLGGATIAQAAS